MFITVYDDDVAFSINTQDSFNSNKFHDIVMDAGMSTKEKKKTTFEWRHIKAA